MFEDDRNYEQFQGNYEALERFSADWRADPELRARLAGGDYAPAAEAFGLNVPEGAELRFVPNTETVFHLPIPVDPNQAISDTTLDDVTGGSSAGTASSIGTLGTVGCSTGPSTVGTGGSVGTTSSTDYSS